MEKNTFIITPKKKSLWKMFYISYIYIYKFKIFYYYGKKTYEIYPLNNSAPYT